MDTLHRRLVCCNYYLQAQAVGEADGSNVIRIPDTLASKRFPGSVAD